MRAKQITDPLLLESFSEEELAAWLGFAESGCKGLGPARIMHIRDYFGDLASAWKADEAEFFGLPGLPPVVAANFIEQRRLVEPNKLLEQCLRVGVTVVPRSHPFYPKRLRAIHDPPTILYLKGLSLGEFDLEHCLSVVGTRRPTAYGQKYAREITLALAQNGVTIISGMAVGIDSLSHRAAIEGGGMTIAVLGSGVDVCYPSSNRPLYEMLASGEHGAVVSEYFPGTKPQPWMFPARNRIIAGMCPGTCIIEAGLESGALITAQMALDEGRDVFALPGRVDSPMSEGTNKLINSPSAYLIRNHEDIMTTCNWAASKNREEPAVLDLYGREKEVYEFIPNEPIHFDSLLDSINMPVGELSATLTMLELGGVIKRLPGDLYART